MKMIANRLWRYEGNTNPLIYMVPQTTKDIIAEKKMNRSLRTTAPSYAKGVVVMKDSSTKKIVFCWKSVAKKSPNKYRNL